MVALTGVEPVRDSSQRILSPKRLPIPPQSQMVGEERFELSVPCAQDKCSNQAEPLPDMVG